MKNSLDSDIERAFDKWCDTDDGFDVTPFLETFSAGYKAGMERTPSIKEAMRRILGAEKEVKRLKAENEALDDRCGKLEAELRAYRTKMRALFPGVANETASVELEK